MVEFHISIYGAAMNELIERMRVFALQLLAVLIDSAFVAGWVVVHTLFEEYVASRFHLAGIHAYTFDAFQSVFALATFFPVAAYVTVDLFTIYRRTRRVLETAGDKV